MKQGMGRHSVRIALIAACLGGVVGAALWAAQPETKPTLPAEPADKPMPSASADCTGTGLNPETGGYEFASPCPVSAPSPDGRFVVESKEGRGVELNDGRGHGLGDIGVLSDAMPFSVFWSPRSDWFFINHYLGSGLERLHIFHIVNRSAIEQSTVFAEATRVAVFRYPCLGRHATVVASGWRWSRDGKRIAMAVYARPDSCIEPVGLGWVSTGDWSPLWMIGDAASGRIDPASVRIRTNAGPMPIDGPYANM